VSRRTRRAALLAVAAILTAASASGCAVGLGATMAERYAPGNGSIVTVGPIQVNNLVIVDSDDGGVAELYAAFVNNGNVPDELTGITVVGGGPVTIPNGGIIVPPFTNVSLGPDFYRVFIPDLKPTLGQVTTVTLHFRDSGSASASALITTPGNLIAGG
jgi:hypothetical protein